MTATFCLGFLGITTQVMFLREMMVVSLGNELTIGLLLATWLLLVGIGAFIGRSLVLLKGSADRYRSVALCLILTCVFFLPFGLHILRLHRVLMHVPVGETAPLGAIFLTALAAFAPFCLCIGLYFPVACTTLVPEQTDSPTTEFSPSVSHVYAAESFGSAVGGSVLSFILLPLLSPLRILPLTCGVGLLGASALAVPRLSRSVLAAAAVLVLFPALARPAWLQKLEQASISLRWRSIAGPASTLLACADTVYQNLALAQESGQFSLYGSGQVMFTFPDPHGTEHAIHFVMAQRPSAEKILLIGGNPLADIPELLKYAPRRLVHVELDPGILNILQQADPKTLRQLRTDPRVQFITEDAPRFVSHTTERFDAVLVNAPEPLTISANRFYTLDFFRAVSRILTPDGFVCISLAASEQLEAEAALPSASVFKTLRAVFPTVLVTAGCRHTFFAGNTGAALTFDRQELFRRSREGGVTNSFFRPEYFLVAEEIAPEKVSYVEQRLREVKVPVNTAMRPVGCFYNLFLWSRFSGSRLERWLRRLYELDAEILGKAIVITGIVLVIAGGVVGLAERWVLRTARTQTTRFSRFGLWSRSMAAILMASTGFLAMSLEVMLLFLFQSMFGYVYAKIGLIVGLFMLGLVLGATTGRRIALQRRRAWVSLGAVETGLFLLVTALPKFVSHYADRQGLALFSGLHESLYFLCVMFVGWAVGTEFTLVNRVFCDAGGTVKAAAAISAGSDSLGSAAGALLAGVLLVPVWGIGGASAILASLKIAGLLCLLSAALATYLPAPR